MTFEPKERGLLDTGAFYAPKSMVGPTGDRILWGWIPEKRDKAAYIASGWSGCMALPRVLHVDVQGHLRMSVSPAANVLLTGPKRSVAGADIAAGHFASLALRIEATLPATDTGFVLTQKGTTQDTELLRIHRVSASEVEINGETIPAPSPTHNDVSAWVDGSVIEIFFADRAAHTVRSYPKLSVNAGLNVFVAGDKTTVSVQALKPISPKRLTT